MERVKGYEIVRVGNDRKLEVAVNEKIAQGWVPIGNPIPLGLQWSQAMVLPANS